MLRRHFTDANDVSGVQIVTGELMTAKVWASIAFTTARCSFSSFHRAGKTATMRRGPRLYQTLNIRFRAEGP